MGLGVDDVIEGVAVPALLVGIGVFVASPLLLKGGRPITKAAVRAYLEVADKVKEVAAERGERWKDLLAEVQQERAAKAAETAAAAAEPAQA
jgi:hypothetical protein